MFLAVAVAIAVALGYGLIRARQKVDQLQAQVVIQSKQVDIDARQQAITERDQQARAELAKLEAGKQTVQTPEQVVAALPSVLPLPKPVQVVRGQIAGMPALAAPVVTIPQEDAKPLYDFAANCQECKVKLATAQKDKQDLQAQIQDLQAQREAALKIGTVNFWHRVGRALKVTACATVGAGVGSLGAGARGAALGAAGSALMCSVL